MLIVFFSSEDFAFDVNRNISSERLPLAHCRGRDVGHVADWPVSIAGHELDAAASEVLPECPIRPPPMPGCELSATTSRATRVTSAGKELSWSTMVLMVFFSLRHLAFDVDCNLL